jgi:hypothetical protein
VGCRLHRDKQHAVGEGEVQADQSIIEENQSIQNERWCVMGYATVQRVPKIQDYATALKLHDNIKPLRGRSPEIKPLGDRRDADTYHIRKDGDAVELVLYKTPVITFMPDGEVTLFVDSYNTVSTHQFLSHVLGISASGVRRTTVLTINNSKYTLADKDKLRLRKDVSGNWQVLNAMQQWAWRLDRKAVTNVRSKYGEFYKYLKGFVNLRTESITENTWNPRTFDGIHVEQSEFKSVFGSMTSVRSYTYMDKRGRQHINYSPVRLEQYKASSNAFEKLIRPDQPEEDKHTNFYKAALLLVAKLENDAMDIRTDSIRVRSKHIVPLLDDVLFMLYADEVLIRKALPQGKVSTGIYEHWMLA